MRVDADAGESVELLQQLIRNACVNDGTAASGQEVRNAQTLADFLDGSGVDVERFESSPGRDNVVARLDGSEPDAPRVVYLGHTDVVPASPERWQRDPFGGELVDGEVWGRGAVDMLNLTATMAVAFRRLARSGFRPRGTLIFAGVADEEALGAHGAAWLLEHHRDAVGADYAITEAGGFRLPLPSQSGPKLPVLVAEKGSYWCTVRVRGTPGHASMPHRTDNALIRAAEVVRRVAHFQPQTRVTATWREFVERLDLPEDMSAALLDPAGIRRLADDLPDLGLAREIHACTHTTFAPTVVRGGVKTNVIPDLVELQLDVRTLPGDTGEDVRSMLRQALGDELFEAIEIVAESDEEATESPMQTPLWDSMARVTDSLSPGASIVPLITTGATDARFYRRLGVPAYGAGLFSDRISFADYGAMFHGDDERIDVESLRLSAEFWERVARDFLA